MKGGSLLYRTIDAAFWTDPKVRKLSADGKLLFLYFITNTHTHVSGLYYVPRLVVQHETGLTNSKLDTLSHTLSSAGLVRFDAENELIWVVNMFRYQGTGEKNYRSAARHLIEDVHKSALIGEFLGVYPDVKPFIPDRVLYRVSEFGTPDPRLLIPEQEHYDADGGASEFKYSADFEEFFWEPYPKKIGKGKAYEEWLKLKPSNGTRERIQESVKALSQSAKWKEDDGRFIPNPATFLHQRRWDDEIGKAAGLPFKSRIVQ